MTKDPEEKRTLAQNRSLHLWFRWVAEALNAAGYDLRKTLEVSNQKIDIPWSETMVKEILWREMQKFIYGKISTTELLKNEEIDIIYNTLNRFFAEKLKMENIPFPSEEEAKNMF